MIFQAVIGQRVIDLTIRSTNGETVVSINGRSPRTDLVKLSPHSYSLLVDGESHYISIRSSRREFIVYMRQQTYRVKLRNETDLVLERYGFTDDIKDGLSRIAAPIPGLVTSVEVGEGDRVNTGDKLLILEAMKMENEITAPVDGVVTRIHVDPKTAVEKGVILMEIDSRA